MALALGVMHAFDADHVMAVTTLASGRGDASACALRWATGHGIALLALATPAVALGSLLPEDFGELAEQVAGAVMVLLGVGTLAAIWRGRLHLHFHAHEGLPPHAHWHRHRADVDHRRDSHWHAHTPTLVGMVHGVASSAPALALIPVTRMGSPWVAIGALVVFCLGVCLAMALVGGALTRLGQALQTRAARLLLGVRAASAIACMGIGVAWLAP